MLYISLAAVAALVVSGLGWTGVWRAWASSRLGAPAVLFLLPAWGLFILLIALTAVLPKSIGVQVGVVAFIVAAGGLTAMFLPPGRYGPRWYREQRYDPRQDRLEGIGRLVNEHVPDEHNSEKLAGQQRQGQKLLAKRRVFLVDESLGKPTPNNLDGVATGSLYFYPSELVFAADRSDDIMRPGPTVRSLPASQIEAVRKVGPAQHRRLAYPSLQIEHSGGAPWRLESVTAGSVQAMIRRTYLSRRDGPAPGADDSS